LTGHDEDVVMPHVFLPEQHALLFGIVARHARVAAGQAGLDAVADGVKAYALQRGGRMRARALANGDPLTFATYMAYSEWAAPAGSMQVDTVRRSPAHITRTPRCPWHAAWGAHGMMEEGYSYCKYIDEYLVRGFNSQLALGINAVHTDGTSDYCEFVWNGFALTPEAESAIQATRERVQNESIRSWEYHVAHLFAALSTAVNTLPDVGHKIIDKSRDEFVAAYGHHAARVLDAALHMDFADPSGRL